MKILHVVGARPNFMKIAPILEAFRASGAADVRNVLVHTGQHYDERMSALFFAQLGIPAPDVNLGVGSASHAVQTAQIMTRFEQVCLTENPTHVLVVGDVNSTIACALVAAKLGIQVIHVEAGLRSFDRRMPEEVNRVLTDAISDVLFTTEESANQNLLREGVPKEKIHFVGNVMIDTLIAHRRKAAESKILEELGLRDGNAGERAPYGVLTLHRAESVDDRETLGEILAALVRLSREMPLVFPVHPRTRARIEAFGFQDLFQWNGSPGHGKGQAKGIMAIEPLGYLDFLRLMGDARVVLTDSGGIQEETTILQVPCVTMRDSTERPVTVSAGTNVIAGTSKEQIITHALAQLSRGRAGYAGSPPHWDGKAASRIVEVLLGINKEAGK
jgi:UDP-N-acetylglucosamine 2-epimerase (non-hydrolysing)